MTLTRYIVVRPNGKIFCKYGSDVEMYFRDKDTAEKVAVSWGKVKEVTIAIPTE